MGVADAHASKKGRVALSEWSVKQLTFGSADGIAHSHSYYDIPVADEAGERVLVHRLDFAERHPSPSDEITVGIVRVDAPGHVVALGTSRAWSWQQGPMAQWIGGGPWAVWNDREDGQFVARMVQVDTGETHVLGRPVYAVSPDGRSSLSLDMARLDHLRPGYGYPSPSESLGDRAPSNSGIWLQPLDGEKSRLILSLDTATAWLQSVLPVRERIRHRLKRYHYWFNHAKFSPDGRRFTVKLRWRKQGHGWSDLQGISLTASIDGSDLRLLADASSHVIWQTPNLLYMWRRGEMALFADTAPKGRRLGVLAEGIIDANVHLRHVPPAPSEEPQLYVFDTPYAETVSLNLWQPGNGKVSQIATFTNHTPPRGPFRCDLHPVPSTDGNRIFVTSLDDGARQLYMAERTG